MTRKLNLRKGQLVEVRPAAEILATLDESGRLEGLPFMPEMLAMCGQTFEVESRADKTCDTIEKSGSRRMYDTVHLVGTKCGGYAHGGCQASCPLFWKEVWLERVDRAQVDSPKPDFGSGCQESDLMAATVVSDGNDESERVYSCQATDLLRASEPLPWWGPRQYVREVVNGNVRVRDLMRILLLAALRAALPYGRGYRSRVWLYQKLEKLLGGPPFIFQAGTLKKTPHEVVGFHEGERVRVRTFDEIVKTLNAANKNRGLNFDAEMLPYCGTVQTVRSRVEKIIDERTGRMIELPNDSIILENVVCRAECSRRRLFCPRNLYPFWREIWLERIE